MSTRIIVFDHSPNVVKLFQVILDRKGYEVIVFSHEVIHIEDIELLHPNLIIFGNLRGYNDKEIDIIDHIKNHTILRSLPVVITTTAPQLIQNSLENPQGIYILPKPFDIQMLLNCVKEALG